MSDIVPSHPWISFTLDLRSANWEFWLLAGEALSKCEHLAGVPIRPETANQLMQVYLAKGVHATTAIEGNTLTEQEVLKRIEGNLKLPPSKEYLGIEVDNIVEASNWIGKEIWSGSARQLTPELICEFNRRVLQSLELEEHIVPGKTRTYSVGVADYRGVPWKHCDELLIRLCDWLEKPWITPLDSFAKKDLTRLEAILKAVVAHLYLAWIHPFGDGNGRTARLVELFLLANAGVPFAAAHLLSNHYNETRSDYYLQLSRASKSGGDVIPFCMYALRGLVDQLREQIQFIRDEQIKLFWQNHVHRTLGESETGRRRQHLVLDLSLQSGPVPKSKLTDVSPRVARDFARKDEKTLSRDLVELERLKLIEKDDNGYRARIETVLAYRPTVKLK